jgi:hypothetical protein
MQSDYIIKNIVNNHIQDAIWNNIEAIMYRNVWNTASFPVIKLSGINELHETFDRNNLRINISDIIQKMNSHE